jgi:hypothetical protein
MNTCGYIPRWVGWNVRWPDAHVLQCNYEDAETKADLGKDGMSARSPQQACAPAS